MSETVKLSLVRQVCYYSQHYHKTVAIPPTVFFSYPHTLLFCDASSVTAHYYWYCYHYSLFTSLNAWRADELAKKTGLSSQIALSLSSFLSSFFNSDTDKRRVKKCNKNILMHAIHAKCIVYCTTSHHFFFLQKASSAL